MKKLSLLIIVILITGCSPTVQTSSTQQGPKESAGAISGMIIGGALANDMAGDSRNKSLATVLGAFVGGVIGQNIGAQLDEREIGCWLGKPITPHSSITQQTKLQNGVTQTREITAVWFQLLPIAKMVGIVENLLRKSLLEAKNKRAMAELVVSLTVLGR